MENTLTLGEKRVRIDFNTTNSDIVHELKEKTARIINLLECLKNDEVSKTYDKSEHELKNESGEKLRLLAIAQTAYEEACMWAVKASTI